MNFAQKGKVYVNPIHDGLFQGCSRMGGGGKKSYISYNDETWQLYLT